MKKQGLNNPALAAAVASSPAGQKAINNGLEKAQKGVSSTVSIVKGVLIIGVLGVGGYIGYRAVFGIFTKRAYDKNEPAPNISTAVAKSKADAIYKAMYGLGDGFKIVKAVLSSVSGQKINHNGFIRIYNEFGKREVYGILPFQRKLTMIEWFNDQYKSSELAELRFKMPKLF